MTDQRLLSPSLPNDRLRGSSSRYRLRNDLAPLHIRILTIQHVLSRLMRHPRLRCVRPNRRVHAGRSGPRGRTRVQLVRFVPDIQRSIIDDFPLVREGHGVDGGGGSLECWRWAICLPSRAAGGRNGSGGRAVERFPWNECVLGRFGRRRRGVSRTCRTEDLQFGKSTTVSRWALSRNGGTLTPSSKRRSTCCAAELSTRLVASSTCT